MAAGALPLGFDPLAGDDEDNPSPLAMVMRRALPSRADENLAFAAGIGQPSSNGTSGALSNAYKEQLGTRLEKDKLLAQYLPLIQQSMMQNFEMSALGATYGGPQGAPQGNPQPEAAQGPSVGAGGAPGMSAAAGMPAGAMPAPAASGAPAGGAPTTGNALFDRVMAGTLPQALQADAMTGARFGFANAWKLAHEGIKQDAGAYYIDPLTNQRRYNPKYPDGMGPEGALPNVVQGTADLETAKATAQKTVDAMTTPLPPTFLAKDGTPIGGSIAQYLGIGKPQAGARDADRAMLLSSELDKTLQRIQGANGDKPTAQAAAQDFFEIMKQMKSGNLAYVPPAARSVNVGAVTPAAVAQAEGATAKSGTPQLQGPAEAAGQKTTAEEAAKSGQTYQNNLHDKVEEEFQLVQRNKQIMPLLDRYNTGGIAPEERLKVGAAIANSGALQSILGAKNAKAIGDKLAGGDVAAGKDLENQLASAAILTMLQTLDKEGKPNRAIFQAVQQAQEGLKSGNATLKDVFELQNRLYGIHYNEQQAMTQAIKSGTYDPRTWAGEYSKIRNQQLQEPAVPLPSAGFNAKPSASTSKFPGFSAVVKGL